MDMIKHLDKKGIKFVLDADINAKLEMKQQVEVLRNETMIKNTRIQELEQKVIELSKLNLEYQEEIREIQELTKDVGDEILL